VRRPVAALFAEYLSYPHFGFARIGCRKTLETKTPDPLFLFFPFSSPKMKTHSSYYVYAYFDPRNYEMLYVGKGHGSRKNAHRAVKAGTEKERRLHAIKQAGLKPLIRVIAANLTEDQAFLVEKALIWRTGAPLINVSGGHYADKFRPPNTLHLSLPGFDTTQGVYFINVDNAPHREWEDWRKYGFLASGYGRKFSSQLDRLEIDSIAAAYKKRKKNVGGYVGIARVIGKPVPASDFRYQGHPLRPRMLVGPELLHDAQDDDKCEYLVPVEWIKHVPKEDARFRHKPKLFASPSIVVSLSGQPKTLEFLEQQFKVNFERLLSGE
jgi:hypothetical protein